MERAPPRPAPRANGPSSPAIASREPIERPRVAEPGHWSGAGVPRASGAQRSPKEDSGSAGTRVRTRKAWTPPATRTHQPMAMPYRTLAHTLTQTHRSWEAQTLAETHSDTDKQHTKALTLPKPHAVARTRARKGTDTHRDLCLKIYTLRCKGLPRSSADTVTSFRVIHMVTVTHEPSNLLTQDPCKGLHTASQRHSHKTGLPRHATLTIAHLPTHGHTHNCTTQPHLKAQLPLKFKSTFSLWQLGAPT